jgi:hypothetical protein
MGFKAAALRGGFNAWRMAHPVEPIKVRDDGEHRETKTAKGK